MDQREINWEGNGVEQHGKGFAILKKYQQKLIPQTDTNDMKKALREASGKLKLDTEIQGDTTKEISKSAGDGAG